MKKCYSIFLLILGLLSFQDNAAKVKNRQKIKDCYEYFPKKKKKRKHCDKSHFIFAKDLEKGHGFVIKKPGHYILCEDIVFNPCGCQQSRAAITIESSDVTLDLGSHSISQCSSDNFNTFGIFAEKVSSFSVSNGLIIDFAAGGIKIINGTDIVVDNISIQRTGIPSAFGGLYIIDSSDILIDQYKGLNNFGCGMRLSGVVNTTVMNSQCNDNVGGNLAPQFFSGPGLICVGAIVESSTNTETSDILIQDCSFNHNTGLGEGGGIEIGPWSLLPVKNVTVVRCEFLNNFIPLDGVPTTLNDSSGFVLVDVDNYVVRDCISAGQRHLSPPGPDVSVAGATGFSINACTNGIIENCQAFDNSGQGSTSIGIRVRGGVNQVIKNCECSGNMNTGSGQAFGFYTDVDNAFFLPPSGTAYVFDSCVAQQNNSASGLSGGFKIARLSSSVIKNCISQENANGIVVTDPGVPQITLNNIFEGNIIQGNTISGINDQVTNGNNVYIGNISRANGPSGTSNYLGLPASTPIVNWSVSGGFPAGTINPFANINVTP